MSEPRVRDMVGIGLGPFNFGLTALLDGVSEDADATFLERDAEFAWHEGILIGGTTLEVPFLADLATLADPTSSHSYLNYPQETGRVYEFYSYETFQIPRREYNDYLRRVAGRLGACRPEREVTEVRWDDREEWYAATARNPGTGDRFEYHAENLALDIGSRPHVLKHLRGHPIENISHAARHRGSHEHAGEVDMVTVARSGQSAAEVSQDLLERQPGHGYWLDWLTRSGGSPSMEYSKLGLQHFTPEYKQYVYDLPQAVKDNLIPNQDLPHKGIDPETSAEIYDLLYRRSVGGRDLDVGLFAMTEVHDTEAASNTYALDCHQWQVEESFVHESKIVILGTGYERPIPAFFEPLEDVIDWDEQGRFGVTEDHRPAVDALGDVFLQNVEVYTHGAGVLDLGLGCYRNTKLVNRLVGREVYLDDVDTVSRDFSVAQPLDHAPNASRAEGSETPPTPTQDD